MRSFPPEELYYITQIDNLQSILEKGILSHARSAQLKLEYTSIYNEEVVSIRRNKITPDGNAANAPTQFYPLSEGLDILRKQWNISSKRLVE